MKKSKKKINVIYSSTNEKDIKDAIIALINIHQKWYKGGIILVAYKETYDNYNVSYSATQTQIKDENVDSRKKERLYYIKQKLSGLSMIVIGIIIPFLLDGDATFSLIALPLGIGLLVTKQRVMNFGK